MADAFTLFDATIGRCAIAWYDGMIRAIRLPEPDAAKAIARLRRLTGHTEPGAAPAFVRAAIEAIAAHLAGRPADLDDLPLDFARVTAFERAVLEACRRVPSGTTTTYGAIARELGDPQAARAVGVALGRNPWPIVVPCHRVVAANGRLGGFSAPGGRAAKLRLLEIEMARMPGAATLFDLARAPGAGVGV